MSQLPSSIHTQEVKPRFYCGECGQKFDKLYSLKAHAASHPLEKGVYGCNNDSCNRSRFDSWENGLKDHKCLGPRPKPYRCIECGRQLQGLSAAKNHPKNCRPTKYPANHDPRETHERCSCGYCGRTFQHPSKLQIHVWDHFGEARMHCCGQNFGHLQLLEIHQQENGCEPVDLNRPPPGSPADLFECGKDQCGRKFPNFTELRTHISGHILQCPFCDSEFMRAAELTKHMNKCLWRERQNQRETEYSKDITPRFKNDSNYRDDGYHNTSLSGGKGKQSLPVTQVEHDMDQDDGEPANQIPSQPRQTAAAILCRSGRLDLPAATSLPGFVTSEIGDMTQGGETPASYMREGPTMHVSNSSAPDGFPTTIRPQQSISLNTDHPGEGESLADDRDFGPRGGDEYTNYDYDGGGDYGDDNTSLGGDEDGQSDLHREAGYGRYWGQDHTEPINQMQPGADSGAQAQYQPQPATENRSGLSFLLNPESSQARSPRQWLAPTPGGSIASREAHSRPSHREAQDDMHWDQDREEPVNEMSSEAGSRGYPLPAAISFRRLLTPASTLEMRESISQCGAMPARHIQDADLAEDYEDGNLIDDDEDEDGDNDDDNDCDYEDSFEDDYRSLSRVSRAAARRKAAVRGAHQQTGILRKSQRLRRQKGRCEEEAVRTNSPAHPVTEGQSPPTLSLSKDSSLTNVSNGPAPIRRRRDQPRSKAGEGERAAKRQRTRHEQQATKSTATEIVQDQGQSRGICLDSPAIATPPAEPSSVHSPPSRSLNGSLDADSAKDGDDDRISSGAFISSETAMVAPCPRGSNVGAHNDGDDVRGARRRSDPPSRREEQRRQQQQDTFERQDIAIEFTAKIGSVLGKTDESVKGAEVRQREAEEKEENIKSRIEQVESWQYHLCGLMGASIKEMRKLEEKLKGCQKEKESAAKEAKHESQRKRDMAQEIEDI